MKKLLLSLVAGVALLAAASRATAEPVTLSVDASQPGAAISPNFSGLSFETSVLLPGENGVRYFRPDNQPLITLFHTLGIKSLRIGGNTSDRDVRRLPSEADLDSLFQFAKAADIKIIYCLRLHDGDPHVDAQTAKYIMDRYAAQMDCFSLGQEPNAYPVEKFKYSDYAADWKKFADIISAAVPGIRFCGPGVHNNAEWARNFIRDFGQSNHVALITEHLYSGGSGEKILTPEIGRDRLLSDDFIHQYKTLHDGFARQAAAKDLPFRLEEVNNVSNTFAAALWGLDCMCWWASHDAAGVNFHTGDTAFFSTTNGHSIRPLDYGITAFAQGSQGQFIPAKILNPEALNLSAYAVMGADQQLYLTIINKEHGTNARAAQVDVQSPGTGLAEGQMMALSSPDNDASGTTGETLGGATIQNDGSWNGAWTPLPDGAIELPPASAVIVKYQTFTPPKTRIQKLFPSNP